jgi:hypothetical protein
MGSMLPLIPLLIIAVALKSNDALTVPQFWAEDATVFFKDQYANAWPQWFVPYAGYLLFVPRSVAWLASMSSPFMAPLTYNLLAVVLASASIAFTASKLRNIVPVPLVLASFLLVPTNGEVFGTITNVQWFLQFVLVIGCITPVVDTHGWRPWGRAILMFALALTGPFSIIVALTVASMLLASWADRASGAGLFEGQLATWGRRRDLYAIASTVAGAAIQGAVLITHLAPAITARPGLWSALGICFLDLVPFHIFGFALMPGMVWIAIYACLLAGLIFGKRIPGEQRLLLLAILVFAFAEAFSPMGLKDFIGMYRFNYGDRYFYLTKVVFWWIVYAALAASIKVGARKIGAGVFLGIAVVALLNPFRMERREFIDFLWPEHAKQFSMPGTHVVPVNPYGWTVTIDTPQAPGTTP